MKTSISQTHQRFHNRVAQKQSAVLLHQINLQDIVPFLVLPKSLVRIERTVLSSSHPERIGKSQVFYRKPLLTREGKLDKGRLALEILSHRE